MDETIRKMRARSPHYKPESRYWLVEALTGVVREVNETQGLACSGAACRIKFLTVPGTGLASVMVQEH